ncbi:hypothetical protein [Streptomyces fulvorobeus]|uniref:ATP-binding protein n=1 Tax=Streptomyces fulvorobeus TaxID=284028 RepID=A0A7Y9HG41_9ACTN|nr:hypothetical protein [Streptomyces fulvorobeus]NYE43638.1 hypothetical protein [Streptomyces fulvorobeus]
MKYAKTAAFVAGSVVALGTAAPAFAVAETTASDFSLDGGLNQAMAAAPRAVEPLVGTVGGVVDSLGQDGAVGKLAGQATGGAQGAAPLLGGVPLGG